MDAVLDIVLNIAYGLFTLGILIFIHELGHYIAGRATGIRVVTFSVGFGRGIFSFERGGTLYKIGWIPIGGYCSFAGDGENLSDDRKGEPDEMYERPAWARLITISAGALFNFVFAIVIFFFLSLTGYSYQSQDNRVTVLDTVFLPEGERFPAFEAGLRSGDRILSVNGTATDNFGRLMEEIGVRPDQEVDVEVDRAGQLLQFRVHTMLRETGIGDVGIAPFFSTVVDEVEEGSPAAGIGLQSGDTIISWNGEAVDSLYALRRLIAESQGQPAVISWERGGAVLRAETAAVQRNEGWILGFTSRGAEVSEYRKDSLPLGAAFLNSFSMFGDTISRTVQGIGLLFRKEVDASKALAGPVRIVQFSGQIMQKSSAAGYLSFLAMISIALGFFNLLPIPAVDGGHIVLTAIEMIRRKRMSFAVLQRIQTVGIVIVLSLFVLVFYFDIMNLIG